MSLARATAITSPGAQGHILGHSPSQILGLDLVPRVDWSVTVRPMPGVVEVRTLIFPLPRHHSPCYFLSPPFPLGWAWLLPCLLRGEGSFRYQLLVVGSLPVLPLFLGPDDPYPFKRSLFGGGDYQSLGTSLGRVYVERVSQSGVSARC